MRHGTRGLMRDRNLSEGWDSESGRGKRGGGGVVRRRGRRLSRGTTAYMLNLYSVQVLGIASRKCALLLSYPIELSVLVHSCRTLP